MAAPHSVDPVSMLEQHLACASPDLLREMIASFANAMMCAQADQACGAGYGERSGERVKPAQRLPGAGVGYPRWNGGVGDPEAARGLVLPGLVADPSPPGASRPWSP
jgi:hypothetical protein